jgi:hypothetical protein
VPAAADRLTSFWLFGEVRGSRFRGGLSCDAIDESGANQGSVYVADGSRHYSLEYLWNYSSAQLSPQ